MGIKIEENLKTALKLLNGKREHEYGNKKQNHENIARLWSAYLDQPISAHDVSIVDMVGYSAIAGELSEDSKEH